jgi:hypothetical protein
MADIYRAGIWPLLRLGIFGKDGASGIQDVGPLFIPELLIPSRRRVME